jgi:triphosphoribosyl-dephospho-CoA synthetase
MLFIMGIDARSVFADGSMRFSVRTHSFHNGSSGTWVHCLLAALLFMSVMTEAATAEPKRIMLLHSFGREFKPWGEYSTTIREELYRQSPWPLDITEQSVVTARSSDEDPEAAFVEYLHALFARHALDLIVSLGAPAAAFVQRHRQQLFTATRRSFGKPSRSMPPVSCTKAVKR